MIPYHEQLNTTLARNFIKQNIIEFSNPSKVIPKQLVEKILPNLHPITLLQEKCPLTDFLQKNANQDVKEFKRKYHEIQQFRLMKFGQYCGYVGGSYVLFSQNMVAFMKQDSIWRGFCYKVNKSAYIGQFANLKSSGDGMALFVEGQKELKKDPIILYHIFNGTWKDGEIEKGTRQTYISYSKEKYKNEGSFGEPLLSYDGGFSNFQFQGEGIRKKGSKEMKGKFEKGKYVKAQIIIQEEEKLSKQKENNSSVQKNNIQSSHKFSVNPEKQSSTKN